MKVSSRHFGLTCGAIALLWSAHAQGGVRLETGGLIVVEAEHFETNQPASGHAWQAVTNQPGYVGDAAMQALPNSGANISSGILTNSPALIYLGNFTNRSEERRVGK